MQQEKKGRGCLFYFFVTLLVLLIVGGGALYYGYRVIMGQVGEFVNQYTESAPRPLPRDPLTEQDIADVQQRVVDFTQNIETGASSEPLVLTGKDINALIASSPELQYFKDSVHVSVEGDQITGEVSLPLADFGYPGRFLNGKATFAVALADDQLDVRISELQVKGEPVPDSVMSALQGQNLAENSKLDQQEGKIIQKIDRLEISDGKVTITPKTAAP